MQSTGSLQTSISLQLKVLFISGIMAVSIPQLDNFISLVGSISCTALAIIFPIFIHILTLTSEGDGRVSVTIFFKDAAIMLMGVLMFMFGTYTSVARIIERYENGQNKWEHAPVTQAKGMTRNTKQTLSHDNKSCHLENRDFNCSSLHHCEFWTIVYQGCLGTKTKCILEKGDLVIILWCYTCQ